MTTPRFFTLTRSFFALASLAVPVFAGCGSSVSGGGGGDDTTCSWQGQTYQVGDSFPAGDGCNTCTCMETGEAACTLMGCVATCTYQGATYTEGQSFPAGDGCNTCTCQADGSAACTEIACAPVCVYAGVEYQPGDSFPALDGCNTCTCDAGGTIGCTEIACACDPAKEWWREYTSMDPQECMLLDFDCGPNLTRFDNTCGCGCQQSEACPPVFDCMPPAQCDVAKIQEECPYSDIAL